LLYCRHSVIILRTAKVDLLFEFQKKEKEKGDERVANWGLGVGGSVE
jgi:hypothetical protein